MVFSEQGAPTRPGGANDTEPIDFKPLLDLVVHSPHSPRSAWPLEVSIVSAPVTSERLGAALVASHDGGLTLFIWVGEGVAVAKLLLDQRPSSLMSTK